MERRWQRFFDKNKSFTTLYKNVEYVVIPFKVYLPYAMTPAILALSVIMLYQYEVLLNPIERQV